MTSILHDVRLDHETLVTLRSRILVAGQCHSRKRMKLQSLGVGLEHFDARNSIASPNTTLFSATRRCGCG